MHTLDNVGPSTVKVLAVSSLGRIVVYSALQPSDDRVKVIHCVCVCVRACVRACAYHFMFSPCMCGKF